MNPQPREATHARDDHGSVTLAVVILAIGLLLLVGLIADGGAKVRAIRRADSLASEAARAGGQAIDLPTVMAGGRPVADPAVARRAALAYLSSNHAIGTASVTEGGRQVRVDVRVTSPTVFLGLAGIDHLTVHGHATATLVHGLRGVIP
jgi:Flp pilus assembly protein TadG